MKKEDKLEKVIRHFVSSKISEMTIELRNEYMKTLEEMSSRGILNSGMTIENTSRRGNIVIVKYIEIIILEIQKYPVKIKEKYWLIIKDILITAIKQQDNYLAEDIKTRGIINLESLSTYSNGLFLNSKSKLENLIEESILKNNCKGFESEAFYKQRSVRLSIIAIIISSISLLSTILLKIFIK